MKKLFLLVIISFILFYLPLPAHFSAAEQSLPASIDLRILETTDIHANLVNYDYYQSKIDNRVGLVKTATLIKQARKEAKNSLLFDNGDHLKGTPLGEFLARIRGLHKGKTHPVYRAFNYLGYDAITIGNHEFNYGLPFLKATLKGLKVPMVNANVYSAISNKPYFKPYIILKRNLIDQKGNPQEIKIGVIGFLPTQIMKWDKTSLEGKVFAVPIVDAAKEFVPKMKAEGADLIIALAHTGISSERYHPDTENAVYYLTKIPGIDVVLAGHSHGIFPGPVFAHLPNTNLEQGLINGKPVVMAGAFGNRLGLVDLQLEKQLGKWRVAKAKSFSRPISDDYGNPLVRTDQQLFKLIKPEHQETVNFIKKLGL